MNDWLDKNGLHDEWRRPFVEPIRELHRLGLQDLEGLIQRNWQKRVLSEAVPLLEKFPFTRAAVTDAAPSDVDETLRPSTGLFWIAWRTLIAPLCVEDEHGWRPMRGVEQLAWPKGIFDTVSQLARLTHTFWDKDSVPKPLLFSIEPEPLPVTTKAGKPEIIPPTSRPGSRPSSASTRR